MYIKRHHRFLLFLFIIQFLFFVSAVYSFSKSDKEFIKQVIMYGTDSDIINTLGNIRENLGNNLNKMILNLFKEDHDLKVYYSAINYFKLNKVKMAKNVLIKELTRKNANDDYIENVIIALSSINTKESINNLIKMYKNRNNSNRIKIDIVDAIGNLGIDNEEVEKILLDILNNKKNNVDLRAHSILALGKIKSKKALNIIENILHNRYEKEILRMYSAYSIKEIEGELAINDLSPLIKDRDPKVAEYATRALADINSPKVGDILIKALRSDYDTVRYYAALGLKKIKFKKAEKILEFKAKYDSNPNVRKISQLALNEIKGKSRLDTKEKENSNKGK